MVASLLYCVCTILDSEATVGIGVSSKNIVSDEDGTKQYNKHAVTEVRRLWKIKT